jgi:uncharacterized protein (TIRG00374 family)
VIGKQRSYRRRLLLGFQIVIAAALMWGLLRVADTAAVLRTLHRADPIAVVSGIAIFALGQVTAAARWRTILASGELPIPLWHALRVNLIGGFAANFLPGMGGGDVVKGLLLFPGRDGRRTFVLSSVLFDRLTGLAATLIVAAFAALWLGVGGVSWLPMQWTFVALTAIALSVAALLALSRLPTTPQGKIGLVAQRVHTFSLEFRRLALRRKLVVRALILSLAFQLSWVASQWCMLLSVTEDAPVLSVAAASPLSLIAAMLPLSLNGLGVREGTFSYLLAALGVAPEQAVATAMLSLLPLLLSSAVGGLLLATMRRPI